MRMLIASTVSVFMTLAAPAAFAQATSGDGSFVGATKASDGCPAITMHILRADTVLSGVVFYTDGSGISSVAGKTDGTKLNWTETSVSGHGPTNQVSGTVSAAGAMDLHVVGTNCEFKTTLPRYTDVTDHGR